MWPKWVEMSRLDSFCSSPLLLSILSPLWDVYVNKLIVSNRKYQGGKKNRAPMANTSRVSRLHSLVPIPRLVVVVVLRTVGRVEVVDACWFWWSPGGRVEALAVCWRQSWCMWWRLLPIVWEHHMMWAAADLSLPARLRLWFWKA